MSSLTSNITVLGGVGAKREKLLNKLGVSTVGDLLRFYPRDYIDLSLIRPLRELISGETACVRAEITTPITEHRVRGNMVLYKFSACDTRSDRPEPLYITLFNNKYLAEKLRVGEEYIFYGRVDGGFSVKQMASPDIEPLQNAAIRPVYRATEGMPSRMTAALVQSALKFAGSIPETLPPALIDEFELMPRGDALKNIHFPESGETLEEARQRLIFEELFYMQLMLLSLKSRNAAERPPIRSDCIERFFLSLPYTPTGAQRRAVRDCAADLYSGRPMNRLIEGDVGSGKTLIAAAVADTVIENGMQCAMMAPTEILAEQHYRTLSDLLAPAGRRVTLLTGSVTASEKRRVYAALAAGETDLIVGTHALIQDKVEFKNLGLVITDEQHRFGVGQRTRISEKGDNPHMMVMSATPIPRTLALIIYGDLDISVIDEKPPGRQEIETYVVGEKYHERLYAFIRKHAQKDLQTYYVCPLIEDNQSDISSVSELYKHLSTGPLKDLRVGLLHGQMKAAQKDGVMREFAAGSIDVLVSTTVIEVGVDVPNAVLMIIENAERFGLSQLHQLRGRVGRGTEKSTCVLISDSENELTRQRLKIMADTSDGFVIAEEDLKLRGPGDFFGTRQHGLPSLKLADMFRDSRILKAAAGAAKTLVETDPALDRPEHAALKYHRDRMLSDSATL